MLVLSALLLCTLVQQTAGSHRSSSSSSSSSPSSSSPSSSSEVRGRITGGTVPSWLKQTPISADADNSHESRPLAKIKDTSGRGNGTGGGGGRNTTIITERFRRPEEGESPICAYRVIEGGIWGQLCFRHTLFGYKCMHNKADCRTEVSFGNLVASLLVNGSVLLRWSSDEEEDSGRNNETQVGRTRRRRADLGTNFTRSSFRHGRGGFELSCWWNGSYTQFECASVHLGSGCRDFLLLELHENIPYRICLRALAGSDYPGNNKRTGRRDCVEFTLPPAGMQDIVIAMTTVGGAICVMLVIICLLVAYITENIMTPTQHAQHTYSYCTHSRH
ncbi:fibronectin type III domain-containing protein 10 [Cololabis saira]|uniref:fibronectin type III domain-containing protein 10 n=1 Tax=Cololabis saira TaxID=129043 RepID=UPI002AD370CB|nr:fibronectin type III domain-containing protein 10 [Cololabis saira]